MAEQELSCTSSVRLSSKETKLLSYLMMNEGKTISTDELFRYVWSDEADMDIGIVWMYISYLREKKIEAVHGNIRIAGEKKQRLPPPDRLPLIDIQKQKVLLWI